VLVTYSPSNTKYRSWLEGDEVPRHSFRVSGRRRQLDDCVAKIAQMQRVRADRHPCEQRRITRDMTFKK
jgi:hypothetical protein